MSVSDGDIFGSVVDANFLTKSEESLLKIRGYTFKHQLGEGSYAKVFLTQQTKEDKPDLNLACKIINTKMAPREFIVKFLPREIDILTKITHPFIVHVYTIYHKAYNYLIFMRHAEMGDLLDYIIAKGELPESLSRIWFHQLVSAMFYLHSLNIAHRDIKCENILITSNYNIKLADFGFARYVTDANGKSISSSTYCGSLAYAAPEVIRGKSYYPKNADIWSLGIVLFIMLNKSMPFHDGNVKILYKQQMARKWRIRPKIEALLSKDVVELIRDILEPDFRKRIHAKDLIENKWFTENGLYLNDDCLTALETTLKFKDEMVSKKHKVVKSYFTKEEKDFTLVAKERDPIASESFYMHPIIESSLSASKEPKRSTTAAQEPGTTNPSRVFSTIEMATTTKNDYQDYDVTKEVNLNTTPATLNN